MNRIREFLRKTGVLRKVLLTAAALLAGLAAGLLLSPFRSISMGNNCRQYVWNKRRRREEENDYHIKRRIHKGI